jgi:hypothetical protein
MYWLGYAALSPYARQGSAVSVEADALTRAAISVARSAENSWTLFGDKSAALSQLAELADECTEEDWDGNRAEALDLVAVGRSEDFVRVLPTGVPLPDFAPEPDGSISLDWIQSRCRMLSVSVGRSNRLAFAWLDGSDSGHGVAKFDGTTVPSIILERIHFITGPANAALRVV